MEGWSPSEKLTYGPSFASLLHAVAELPSKRAGARRSARRNPQADANVGLVDSIVATVIVPPIRALDTWAFHDVDSLGAPDTVDLADGTAITMKRGSRERVWISG